ncbi:hypothetical protein [Streptomyces lavendofoliae]|uniref:Uncharacterized protein n=1 Tax=Streptomyces lavendofoliae TaxID=67314 RepID=A0A918I543_9ACTN|nr:hypothetical protein [Streptomyces lavendofoliae]GGU65307.1 hypothetical protein GCM10010274_62440 [Streptomyces lavendofoliae]
MSGEQDASTGVHRGAGPTVTEQVADVQLQMLCTLVTRNPRTSVPVTLHLPSGIIHGDLIAHEAWKAEWSQSLRHIEGQGAHLLAQMPELVDQTMDELSGDHAAPLPRWIHLREVTSVAGGTPVSAPLWRGRLADVLGWSLGKPPS